MQIELDQAPFDLAARGLDHAAEDLAHRRRRLEAEVAGLLDGAWSGAAARSFGEAWSQWLEGAAQVETGLAGAVDLLEHVRGDLLHQDAAARDALLVTGRRLGERTGVR
ncbi:MAG: WXG100 family type VII secretion target [Nocardioides sp.]